MRMSIICENCPSSDFGNPQGMSNTSDFIMLKEDHTLGNLIAEHLKAAPHVMMAGYKSK